MVTIPFSNCVRCCFVKNPLNESVKTSAHVEVFFVETVNIDRWVSYLMNFVSEDEQRIASKFSSEIYKKTFLSCHALLRLILAARLHVHPSDLSFIKGKDNKPGLPDNPAFFNISHTKEAFAIAYVKDFHVGIDLEEIVRNIDFHSIIENNFSKKEYTYIMDSQEDAINRFFLLWTRKEALLKAIGTGIINNLNQIDVSEPVNFLTKELFNTFADRPVIEDYFIYSFNSGNFVLSLAIPEMSSISVYNLNEENLPIKIRLTD